MNNVDFAMINTSNERYTFITLAGKNAFAHVYIDVIVRIYILCCNYCAEYTIDLYLPSPFCIFRLGTLQPTTLDMSGVGLKVLTPERSQDCITNLEYPLALFCRSF